VIFPFGVYFARLFGMFISSLALVLLESVRVLGCLDGTSKF